MKRDKILIFVSAILVAIMCFSIFIVQAFSVPLYAPVVITFGNSTQVQTSTETVLGLYPNARVIKYEDIGNIFNVLTLMRSNRQLILIGHGSNKGLLTATGKIISWQNIAKWVNTLPNTNVYFLSCDSSYVTQLVNKSNFGFKGAIDGPLGAYEIAVMDNKNHGLNLNTNNALLKLFGRYLTLKSGGSPLYLGLQVRVNEKTDYIPYTNLILDRYLHVQFLLSGADATNFYNMGGALTTLINDFSNIIKLAFGGSLADEVSSFLSILASAVEAVFSIIVLQSPPGDAIFGFWVDVLPLYTFGAIIGYDDYIPGSIDPTGGLMCTDTYNAWKPFATGTWVTIT